MDYRTTESGFRLSNNSLIDSRFGAPTFADVLSSITNVRYKGLRVFVTDESKEYWFRDGIDDTDLIEYNPQGPYRLTSSTIYDDAAQLAGIPNEYKELGTEVFIVNATLSAVGIEQESGADPLYEVTNYKYNGSGWVKDTEARQAVVRFYSENELTITNGSTTTIPDLSLEDKTKDVVAVVLHPWKSTKEFCRFTYNGSSWVIASSYKRKIFLNTAGRDRLTPSSTSVCCIFNIVETPTGTTTEYRWDGSQWKSAAQVTIDQNLKIAETNLPASADNGQEVNLITGSSPNQKVTKYVRLNGKWEIMSGTQEVRFTIPASGAVAPDNADVSIRETGGHTVVTIPHNFSIQYIDVSIYDDSDDNATRGPKVYAATECVELPNDAGFAVEITFDQSQASLGDSKFIAIFQK